MALLGNEQVSEAKFSDYADRQNRGEFASEYPKMLYRAGGMTGHVHDDKPLKMQGGFECETLIVADEEGEIEAMGDGWVAKPSLAAKGDDAPRRGRPPVNKDATDA